MHAWPTRGEWGNGEELADHTAVLDEAEAVDLQTADTVSEHAILDARVRCFYSTHCINPHTDEEAQAWHPDEAGRQASIASPSPRRRLASTSAPARSCACWFHDLRLVRGVRTAFPDESITMISRRTPRSRRRSISIPRELGKPVLLDAPFQIKHIAFARLMVRYIQVGQPLPLAAMSPVIRIISFTYELLRITLETWPPDLFPKSPLPRRFQPTPK